MQTHPSGTDAHAPSTLAGQWNPQMHTHIRGSRTMLPPERTAPEMADMMPDTTKSSRMEGGENGFGSAASGAVSPMLKFCRNALPPTATRPDTARGESVVQGQPTIRTRRSTCTQGDLARRRTSRASHHCVVPKDEKRVGEDEGIDGHITRGGGAAVRPHPARIAHAAPQRIARPLPPAVRCGTTC